MEKKINNIELLRQCAKMYQHVSGLIDTMAESIENAQDSASECEWQIRSGVIDDIHAITEQADQLVNIACKCIRRK